VVKLASILMAAYVVSQGFDSAIRWLLAFGGLAPLIYLRDVGLAVSVGLCLVALIQRNQEMSRSFWVLWITAGGVLVAIISGLPLTQVLFGIKVFLPVIAGFFLMEAGATAYLNRPGFWLFIWFAICMGVVANYFVQFPWSGLSLTVGDTQVVANREWTAGGIRRLSGFARTSFDAALIILLLFVYLVMSVKSKLLRFGLVLLSLVAMVLTTSKGVVGVFVGALVILPFFARKVPLRGARWLASAMIYSIAGLGLILPIVSLDIPFPHFRKGTVENWLFSSLMDRAWNTWPDAFASLHDWQFLTGRGIGGVGTAQLLFERTVTWNSADNLFVYIYVTAGLVGALLYIFFSISTSCLSLQKRGDQMALVFLFCLFGYGVTANLIEESAVAIVLGGLLSFCSMRVGHRFFRLESRNWQTAA
jgi:hypothetical protein